MTYWGNSTWLFLHTFALKIKEEDFHIVKNEMIEIFKSICFVLPCPYCQIHAKQFISSNNFTKIKNKQDFIIMLWSFHNIVNKKTGKKPFSYDKMNIYEKAVLKNVIINFQRVFMRPINNQRLLMDSLGRSRVVNKINNFFNIHHNKFNF
tara:strand:- start:814 stop:1263 length:450 start_codon:yes stop_codon:yes gene_type:complete